MISRIIYFLLALVLIMSSSMSSCASSLEVLSEDADLYKEILPVATQWKDAVISKDIDVLVSFALPESKESVKNHLITKESNLYKLLYSSDSNSTKDIRSFYDILQNAEKLKIVIQRHNSLKEFGSGVSVYYYDSKKIEPIFLMDDKKVQLLIDRGRILKMFFFKANGRWYTSYEFYTE